MPPKHICDLQAQGAVLLPSVGQMPGVALCPAQRGPAWGRGQTRTGHEM